MDHAWEEKPLEDVQKYHFDLHGMGRISLTTMIKIVNMKSLRVCKTCGQESVNGEDTKETCDEAQARKIMES